MFRKDYQDVKSDPQKHISNRSSCYHPSPLHKSIREDDIDTFQSLLYKSNYSVNYIIEFSMYERAQTIDSNISLIRIAATYGSIKIFSFCGCKMTLNCQRIYFFMLFSVVTMKSFIFVKRNFLTKKRFCKRFI